ncbi:MAG: NAD(+) synthase [Firmicutes bacterium]|nr:NAD(+) synthase [Bacillota bacterium]
MKYGFVKVEAISPDLRVADCTYNTEKIIEAMEAADERGSQLVVFPELCITGYTCGDLFLQQSLLEAAKSSMFKITEASMGLNLVVIVGVPLEWEGKLYNCAAVICGGDILGIIPKTYLPNYCELYERRWFSPAPKGIGQYHTSIGFFEEAPFGTDLVFRCNQMPEFTFGVEICEDLWAPVPPSTFRALGGANIIVNLSASNEVIGKNQYRRQLVTNQSARLLCGYVYASAGHGESTTDMVFSGSNIIAENGVILHESVPFGEGHSMAEIDVARLCTERMRNTSFRSNFAQFRCEEFDLDMVENTLTRTISPTPFIPSDEKQRTERCELILNIQADGLSKRIEHTHSKRVIIGISGGLDSCLALLASVRAMKQQGLPTNHIHAITMPCFGTSHRTRSNAEILCKELGVTFEEINITDTVLQHFKDIGQDPNNTNTTFENSQARIRTLVLMDKANQLGGLVVGTGDLSELALGWATYNGDHMSMYGINAGIPKTLVRHIVNYEADLAAASERQVLADCLRDILDTPVSPELLPTAETGEIAQQTESIIGPYELHDFYLYYVLRFGFTPKKIFFIAKSAFLDKYEDTVLLYWLRNFYRRFFAQQFKRSCLPDGPKVGSITLSPRGDWRMPSDAVSAIWLEEIDELESMLN